MNDQSIAQQNIRIQKYVVIVAAFLFALKLVAWWITQSVAIYTDMLESIVNILAAGIGLYSLTFSAKPRDRKHPYGHGKIEFVSAAIEGAFICAAGLAIIAKVIHTFRYGHTIAHLDIGIGLIGVTGIVNYALGYYCVRQGRKNKSLALSASGRHLQSDTWSTLGIILGLAALHFTGYALLDQIIAAVMAGFIIHSGIKIMREAFAGIVDEADLDLIEEVVAFLNENRRPNWIDLHNLRIIKYGRVLHFDAHMTVPGSLTVHQAHEELDIIENLFKQKYGQSIEMFIHLDPSDAPAIQGPRPAWSVEAVLQKHRHIA